MARRTDERADKQDETQGTTMKRRGILAAAAALVAGMVAKQTSQPVAAATGGTQGTPLILGANFAAGTANTSTQTTEIFHNGATVGSYYYADAFVAAASSGGTGVQGKSSGDGIGVYGTVYPDTSTASGVYGSTGAGTGVQGLASTGTGVYGESSGDTFSKSVYGKHTSGYAVYGLATASGGYGVTGIALDRYGVLGQSGSGIGVQGQVTSASATNTIAVSGTNYSAGAGGVGVQGQCDAAGAIGVIGASSAGTGVKGAAITGFPMIGQAVAPNNTAAGVLGIGTAGPGVQGQSTTGHGLVGTTDDGAGHAGLIGNANTTGGIGLMGIAPNYGQQTVGHAGEFYGNVKIYGGSLLAPVVQASVKHPGDGTYRALHSLATPDGWIEHFGAGTLAADKADITLDHDFAALIQSDYHVFLTAHGPQNLYVTQQTGSGFTVMAMAWATGAGGPKPAVGGGTFSWRVVGKRKDVSGERLAKVAAPGAPPRPSAFEIPKTPEVKAPDKQP